MPTPDTYYTTLTAAINDMAENGYDSAERVAYWQSKLREAAERSTATDAQMGQMLRETLQAVYRRLVDKNGVVKYHPGVGRFTLDRLRPYLRPELDRRIAASYDLIKLNRAQAIAQTQRRFSGWSTSLPKGGPAEADKRKLKAEIRKPLAKLPFEERRLLIDQGHKLVSSINDVIAKDGGAIAMIWHSHWRQRNYNYRPDHKERDLKTFAIRGSWALKSGLMTVCDGYLDEITQPAEAPFCRCYGAYVYNLRQLMPEFLTKKGELELERAKALVAA